jgi:DNA-binding NarL/FixJ family response regulator
VYLYLASSCAEVLRRRFDELGSGLCGRGAPGRNRPGLRLLRNWRNYFLSSFMDKRDIALARLSSRERRVLQMVAEGSTSSEIAPRLSLSSKTVETCRSRLMTKLGVRDFAGLIKFAIQHGTITAHD